MGFFFMVRQMYGSDLNLGCMPKILLFILNMIYGILNWIHSIIFGLRIFFRLFI